MHKLHNLIDRRIQNPPPIVQGGAYRADRMDRSSELSLTGYTEIWHPVGSRRCSFKPGNTRHVASFRQAVTPL
jgi:hypothetical protein